MKLLLNTVLLSSLFSQYSNAFNTPSRTVTFTRNISVNALLPTDDELKRSVDQAVSYDAGSADGELAKRFGHLSGKEVRTVGETFREFTDILGTPINALYKNMMTDIVGSTHLIVVDARFKRDPVWSLGLTRALDVILNSYPESETAEKMISSLCECMGLNQEEIRAESKIMTDWAEGKTVEDVNAAFKAGGTGDTPFDPIVKLAKEDQYWMYSRYFGVGLIQIMELVGVEPTMDAAYPLLEEWIGKSLGASFYTAWSDGELYFKTKGKIDMMETLMKEIEIREKKKMADRLEEKAEMALRQAAIKAEFKEDGPITDASEGEKKAE